MNNSKKSFILAGSIIGTLFIGNSAYASTYQVKSGDSLYKISKAKNITIQKLKSQNNLSSNLIFPGQVLKINESTAKTTGSTKKHVVKLGDTLSDIAKKYNLSLTSLMKMNPSISNSDRIRIGQSIIVSGIATTANTPATTSSSTGTYKVKSGDNLSNIAKTHKTTVKALLSLNPSIKNANALQIGQSIKISGKATTASTTTTTSSSTSTYIIKSGDNLSTIAKKYKTTVTALLSLNPSIKNVNALQIGKSIKVSGKATTASTNYTTTTTVSSTSEVDRVLTAAKKYLGAKYLYAASTSRTDAFDCSSFTMKAFQAAGISLPRTSTGQAQMGVPVSSYSLKKGDLVFYDTNRDGVINHVGIYAGNNQMINASSSRGVSYADINSSYWKPLYVKAVRILN
ncbi:LysM peptidoglycan-binding domain-containing protein [Peribacillus sp. NPDC097675]|uniref:C40 family peptidase n=1 Tax=Peribacillus sp. NPDC097675 TaxID=3390618 RepID=UPI003D01B6F9